MWQDCLNSEITFWVLVVADIFMVIIGFVGFVWYWQDDKKKSKIVAERIEYLKRIETFKK